jgi:hypothetical protein
MPKTSLLIRAQALGGKFLGSDIDGFFLTVNKVGGGQLFPQTWINGDAGVKPAPLSYQSGSSVATVVTPPTNFVSWIVPDATTVGKVVDFEIDEPTWIEVVVNGVTMSGSVSGSVPLPNQHEARVQTLVPPGAQLTTNPGLVVVMPGLDVRVLTPSQVPGPIVNIQAWVTMMCGCQISNEPNSPWISAEFQVEATLSTAGYPPISTRLALQDTSKFGIELSLAPGSYEVMISAVQPGLGNTGCATGRFTVIENLASR